MNKDADFVYQGGKSFSLVKLHKSILESDFQGM